MLPCAETEVSNTISSCSYAFNLAASDELMDAKEAGVVYDRIEDAIVQADEVDGKMLQVSNHPTQIISPCALLVDFNSSLPNTVKKPSKNLFREKQRAVIILSFKLRVQAHL